MTAVGETPTNSTTLLDQVRKTAEAREKRETLRAAIQVKRDAFEASIAEESVALKSAQFVAGVEEESLRALALVAFNADPDKKKKPAPGVGITESKTLEYNEAAALAWARETKLALVPESLDKPAFAKIAAATRLPFVTYGVALGVKLSTDLNAALAAEEK